MANNNYKGVKQAPRCLRDGVKYMSYNPPYLKLSLLAVARQARILPIGGHLFSQIKIKIHRRCICTLLVNCSFFKHELLEL